MALCTVDDNSASQHLIYALCGEMDCGRGDGANAGAGSGEPVPAFTGSGRVVF
jgi:hypothetical protein